MAKRKLHRCIAHNATIRTPCKVWKGKTNVFWYRVDCNNTGEQCTVMGAVGESAKKVRQRWISRFARATK